MPASRPSRTPSSATSSAMTVRRQGRAILPSPMAVPRPARTSGAAPSPTSSRWTAAPTSPPTTTKSPSPFLPRRCSSFFPQLGIAADSAAPERWFGETTLTASGYAASLPVCGQTVSGTALRRALGLRSACFTIRYQDGNFLITTKGYGHGVGLSQWGAKALAEQGWTYEAILAHYFPGTQLCR